MGIAILVVGDSTLAGTVTGRALTAPEPARKRRGAGAADGPMRAVAGSAVDAMLVAFDMPRRDGPALAGALRSVVSSAAPRLRSEGWRP